MKNPECERWQNEPESLPLHPASCAACAAREEELAKMDRVIEQTAPEPAGSLAAILTERLPVAPWEGARARSWTMVFVSIALFAVAAAVAFAMLGVSPLAGFVEAMRGVTQQGKAIFAATESMGAFVRNAPAVFHIMIGVGVILVNVLLVAMLRRGPRGYDVRPR
jgi:hypothetical protein